MENNLKDNESKDREQKQIADDDLALLLDSIDKETTDLTEVVLEEESLLDDIDLGGEKDLPWLDSGVFEGVDFESDLKSADDSVAPLPEVEPVDEDSGTEIDSQGEDEKMLTEKEVVSSKDDAAMTDTSKDGAVQGTDKTLTGPATTPDSEVSRSLDEAMGKEQAAEEVPASDDQLSIDPSSSDYELVNEVEEKGGEGEKLNSDALANELGTLLNKRMEAIATRLVEERMSAIVEPIVLETIKKLLISMEKL